MSEKLLHERGKMEIGVESFSRILQHDIDASLNHLAHHPKDWFQGKGQAEQQQAT